MEITFQEVILKCISSSSFLLFLKLHKLFLIAAEGKCGDGNCSSSYFLLLLFSQLAPNLAMASENPTCNQERDQEEDLSDLSMHFID